MFFILKNNKNKILSSLFLASVFSNSNSMQLVRTTPKKLVRNYCLGSIFKKEKAVQKQMKNRKKVRTISSVLKEMPELIKFLNKLKSKQRPIEPYLSKKDILQ